MEYGALVQSCAVAFGSLSNCGPEADFIDELLEEGCWLETTGGPYPSSQSHSHYLPLPPNNSEQSNASTTSMTMSMDPNPPQQQILQEETEAISFQPESSFVESAELAGKRWWIGPKANSSVRERLVVAVGYLKEYTKNMTNVLIQIWVPPLRRGAAGGGGGYLDPNCKSLSLSNEDSDRVFLGKWPDHEWTLNATHNPNVHLRFFRSHEYPRVYYAQQQQQFDVRGSLALPLFERGTGICLGVVEFVMTYQNRPDLHNTCHALQAIDFRGCQNFIPSGVKVFDELYQAALNEIIEVLTSVCKTYNLPLALTWAPCIQQGKGGCGHSNEIENYNNMCSICVSTVDSACFVGDLETLGFQEACSEYHLLGGQGIVGTAFTTTKPCFATDITAFSKAEYPLAPHANMFGLHAAVAIPLRSVYTGSSADFVLEFFLPKHCLDSEEQKQMLNSLSILVQQACRSLHVVTGKDQIMIDEEEQFTLPIRDGGPCPHKQETHPPPPTHHHPNPQVQVQVQVEPSSKESSSSWIAHMMEAQQKGKGVSVCLEYLQEEPKQEFKVTTNWGSTHGQVFSDFGQLEQSSGSRGSVEGGGESYTFGGRRSSSGGRKSGEKRRTKAEKTISLPVLRQYFAGSLKDAAKSIGVCPTTLKRICRQHGITRWPSRKIKKVGHSLRKLQLVIDSVQGAEGAIQIGSFYTSFPELSSTDFSASGPSQSSKISDQSKQFQMHQHPFPDNALYNHGVATLKSPPSSCSQTSGPTISCAPTGNQPSTIINGDALTTENPDGFLNRAHSEAELHASIQEDTKHFARSKTQKLFSEHPSLEALPPLLETSGWNLRERGVLRVKATFGDEKIRFSLQPNWGFRDLQLEIARRFNLNDVSNIDLKYLDDDREWVLLTCDADLEECKDIYWSSQSRTIRLSLFQASPLNLANTFGSSSPS